MKTLRNIDVGRGPIRLLDDHDANLCPQLGNLDSFSLLYLCNVEDGEKLLRGFPRVRNLKLEISESWDCRGNCDQFQVLHSLNKLESLNLHYSRQMPHACAINFPTALKKLTLSGFNHPRGKMSIIGKLPNLEVLKLLHSAIGEETWHVEDEEFLNLKYLKSSRSDISHWEASTSSFPCLERLVVRDCHFLVEFPSIFEDVLTLEVIHVDGCLKSLGTSAESIRDEQQDMGNKDIEVRISNVFDDNPMFYFWGNWSRFWPCLRSKPVHISPIRWNYKLNSWDEKFAYETLKSVRGRSVAFIKRRHVPSVPGLRRANLLLKHNCQSRQAITCWHTKEELKRDR